MKIKINLLPPHFKELQKKKRSIRLDAEILWKILLILIALEIFLGILKGIETLKIRKIEKNRKNAAFFIKEADSIKRELRSLEKKVSLLEEIRKRKFSVSLFFDNLLDILPEGIWFSKVVFAEKEISLQGSSVSLGEFDESLYVEKLIEKLRTADYFKNIIKNVELESLKRRTISKTEIADFSIWISLR